MRLLSALWLPPEALAALVAAGAGSAAPRGWRAVVPTAWHITLAHHHRDDPGVLARRLDRLPPGIKAPQLRLAGAGASPRARWADVDVAPPDGLADLVTAAGGERSAFRPHVTLLRRRRRPAPGDDPDPPLPWSAHCGPWWSPREVLLVAVEPMRGSWRYRPVHRVCLGG